MNPVPLPLSATEPRAPRLLLLLLCLLAAFAAPARQSRLLTLADGLQNTDINALYVDRSGMLWLSTQETLELFDGFGFRSLACADSATGERLFYTARQVVQVDAATYLVATNVGLFRYHRPTDTFRRLLLDDHEPTPGHPVSRILPLPQAHRVVVVSEQEGIFALNTETMTTDPALTRRLRRQSAGQQLSAVFVDSRRRLWTASRSRRLVLCDARRQCSLPLTVTPAARAVLAAHRVTDMAESVSEQKVFLATDGAPLLVYDGRQGTLRMLRVAAEPLAVAALLARRDGTIAVGTENRGLWCLDAATEQLVPMTPPQGSDAATARVHALAEDADGTLLAGIFQRGLLVLSPSPSCFVLTAFGGAPRSQCVSAITADARHRLWTATDGGGVFRIDTDGTVAHVDRGLASPLSLALAVDGDDRVWVGGWNGGLQVCASGDQFATPAFLAPLAGSNVMHLVYEPRSRCLVVGTNGQGLWTISLRDSTAVRLTLQDDDLAFTNVLCLDSDGAVWVAATRHTYRLQPASGRLERLPRLAASGSVGSVACMAQQDSTMLFGMSRGIVRVSRRTLKPVDDPLLAAVAADNVKLMEVSGHHIWYATSGTLCCLDTRTGVLVRRRDFGGNDPGMFHPATSFRSPSGLLHFGADNGMLTFHPDSAMRHAPCLHPLTLTLLLPSSRPACPDSAVLDATSLRLPRGTGSLRVRMAAPCLASPASVLYRYRLVGYDDQWHEASLSPPVATYFNLPPGHYTFEAEARMAADPARCSQSSLSVTVPPPLWRTGPALLLYAALLALAVVLAARTVRGRRRARRRLREERRRNDITTAKLRMFARLARELRSPLTLMLSPLAELASRDDCPPAVRRTLDGARHHGQRTMAVVGQLADIERIDSHLLRMQMRPVVPLRYVRRAVQPFEALAAARAVRLAVECRPGTPATVWLDPVHFDKALSNLLSNAFRHTPPRGSVTLTLGADDDLFTLSVRNTGPHIAPADLPHVFERFYQGASPDDQDGPGIGLHLTRQLVLLHHGTITVRNVPGPAVEFLLRLPLGNGHLLPEEISPQSSSPLPADPVLTCPAPRPSSSDFMERVDAVVRARLADPGLSVDALARAMAMSRAQLDRRFKQATGLTPVAYIRSARLRQAAYLMASKHRNVSEAACETGFATPNYFATRFREHFGMTPSEFIAAYSDLPPDDDTLRRLLE